MGKVSVVINTLNEADNLPIALASIKDWADEILVVDMYSEDDTVKIAQKNGAKVLQHKRTGYVEPARNFAISQTKYEWVLILDADEELTKELKKALIHIIHENKYTYVRIPRKNIIFGKWIQHSNWWPDYNVRFFKKGHVVWNDAIHSVPITTGSGLDIPSEEKLALIHHHYHSISQYIQRMDRYTSQQVKLLLQDKYKFSWKDLVSKPINEFLSRYFAGTGYKDGLHGLALALLQAFSDLVLYLKVWEAKKFPEEEIHLKDFKRVTAYSVKDVFWWIADLLHRNNEYFGSLVWKFKRRLM